MKKLTEREYEQYWITTHNNTKEDLASVCFPDKPLYFNLFFDQMQRYALKRYIKKERISLEGKMVLDIGCGRGRWLSFYEHWQKAIVRGIDISEYAVHICKKQGFAVCQGSIIQLPFQDSCFDFINSVTVLMHLPYEFKEKSIAEISRVLQKGGKAILIEGTWEDASQHVYGWTAPKWERKFNEYGLQLSHRSGHCFNWFRTKLPPFIPFKDFLGIYLDYPLEYGLMHYFYGKESDVALQHLMVFEK